MEMLEILDTTCSSLFDLVSLDTEENMLHDPFVKYWEELDLDVVNSINDILAFNPNLIIFSTAHSCTRMKTFIKILNLSRFNFRLSRTKINSLKKIQFRLLEEEIYLDMKKLGSRWSGLYWEKYSRIFLIILL